MKTLRIILAALLLACLPAACDWPGEPVTTAETTAGPAIVTEAESTAQEGSTQPISDDLLDLALLDRWFSMTYADFCREEGRAVEPEGMYDGGAYCYFSKYGDSAPFFFDAFFDAAGDAENPMVHDPENNLLNAVYLKASAVLLGRQSITLGEMKRLLGEQGIVCTAGVNGEGDIRFFFKVGKYEFMGNLESEEDSAPVERFEIYCKSNYS
ncbi:MAG: hypothetical protein LBB75_07540 [Oscillospiraceae bacterium]|jgi:hypothetical protein|nr:hypothetical protein [Oscillospiraceae bacterium]